MDAQTLLGGGGGLPLWWRTRPSNAGMVTVGVTDVADAKGCQCRCG